MKRKFKADRDRYRSDVHVNDEYNNRYFISEKHNSLVAAQNNARLTRKEEDDCYNRNGVRAHFFTHIYKTPKKKYKRI